MQATQAEPQRNTQSDSRFGGMLHRRTVWRLTLRGWLAVTILFLLCAAIVIRGIHPFLAVNAPVEAEVLVVEGWVPDYAMRVACNELEAGHYQRIFVTGVPIERGAPLAEYKNYANLGAAVLSSFGVPTNQVLAVPSPSVRRDRTYTSALEVKDWFAQQHEMPSALNVLTLGLHARRSHLLYEKAFGDDCQIGVISVEEEDYDPKRWWAYSQGVRSVMSETVGYLYVRLFFNFSAEKVSENE